MPFTFRNPDSFQAPYMRRPNFHREAAIHDRCRGATCIEDYAEFNSMMCEKTEQVSLMQSKAIYDSERTYNVPIDRIPENIKNLQNAWPVPLKDTSITDMKAGLSVRLGYHYDNTDGTHIFAYSDKLWTYETDKEINDSWEHVDPFESHNTGMSLELVEYVKKAARYFRIGWVKRRNRTSLYRGAANEEKARQLLQRFIGQKRFFRYIRDGFVSIKGRSGKIYQVHPGHGFTSVWKDGIMIEQLCLVFKNGRDLPPTDSVVMRMLMIESSEEEFREKSHKWSTEANRRRRIANRRAG